MSLEDDVKRVLKAGQNRAQSAISRGRVAREDAEKAGAAAEASLELATANRDAILLIARAVDRLRPDPRR